MITRETPSGDLQFADTLLVFKQSLRAQGCTCVRKSITRSDPPCVTANETSGGTAGGCAKDIAIVERA